MNSKKIREMQRSLTIQDMNRHRRLYNYIFLLYRNTSIKKDFCPVTNQILLTLPKLSFVPCFFLSYCLCRYNELFQISIEDIKQNSSIKIKSSKSKHIKLLNSLPLYKPVLLRSIDLKTFISVVSYDKLKMDILKTCRLLDIPKQKGLLDATHLFRHIEASWLSENKVPLEQISYKLGHESNSSTSKYIHPIKQFYP